MTSTIQQRKDFEKVLTKYGIKKIPVRTNGKEPKVVKLTPYLKGEKVWNKPIPILDNIGIINGKVSNNTITVDIEKLDPNDETIHIPVEKEIFEQAVPDWNDTYTTNTGSGGYHSILQVDNIPEKTVTYRLEIDEENIYQIDLKTTGFCVESTSSYGEKSYDHISDTDQIKKTTTSKILKNIEDAKFVPKSEINKKKSTKSSTASKTEQTLLIPEYNDYLISDLAQGNWQHGKRRAKQKSYYIQLRRNRISKKEAIKKVTTVLKSCKPKLSESEIKTNFESAEEFFQDTVLPQWGYTEGIIQENHSHDTGIFTTQLLQLTNRMGLDEEFYINAGLWNLQKYGMQQTTQQRITEIKKAIAYSKKEYETQLDEEFKKTINYKIKEDDQDTDFLKLIIKISTRIAEYLIERKSIIEYYLIDKKIHEWILSQKIDFKLNTKIIKSTIRNTIKDVFDSPQYFRKICDIAYRDGVNKKYLQLDGRQTNETAYWLRGFHHIKRVEINGKLIFFNTKHYEFADEELISRYARDVMHKPKPNQITEVFSILKDTAKLITNKDLMTFAHVICLNNGLYDTRKGKFTPKFSPDYIIMDKIPHAYDETATFTEIKEIQKTILPEQRARQSYDDFLSLCFDPFNGVDFQLGGVGVAGSGKSTLCNLAELAIGENNVSDVTIHKLATDPTTLNDIMQKRLNIDREISEDDVEKMEIWKKIITRDGLQDRSVYLHSEKNIPKFRIMFMGNHIPEITNEKDTLPMYQRTQLIRVEQKIRGTDKDKKKILDKKVNESELNGFVTYLLKNAYEINKKENIHNPMTADEVEAIWEKSGNQIKDFANKWIVKDSGKTVRTSVWRAWENHCIREEIGTRTPTKFYKNFETFMKLEWVSTRIEGEQERVYNGIRIFTPKEVADIAQQRLKENDTTKSGRKKGVKTK